MTAEQWFKLFAATLSLGVLFLTMMLLLSAELDSAVVIAIVASIVGHMGAVAMRLLGGGKDE